MSTVQPDMKVRYKSDPAAAGWVIAVSGETARVFIDGSAKLVPTWKNSSPSLGSLEVSPESLRVVLTQRRLEHPATDQLLSYRASRTRLLYHQFLPVKKMLESPDQRLLIADEVGTGKTIEAGLIWSELESRSARGLENVWIICPKSLVGKVAGRDAPAIRPATRDVVLRKHPAGACVLGARRSICPPGLLGR